MGAIWLRWQALASIFRLRYWRVSISVVTVDSTPHLPQIDILIHPERGGILAHQGR